MRIRSPTTSFKQGAAAFWLGHGSRPLQQLVCLTACLAAGGMLAYVAVGWQAQHQTYAVARERLQLQQAQFVKRKPAAKVAALPLTIRDAARHNLAVGQLNTPWSDVFDGMERQAQTDVGLTLLEPDTKKGTLRVQAEARDVDGLIAYAQRLAADPAFSQLGLQQHETNEQDPNRPVRLSFDVRIVNASSGESAR